MEGLQEFVGGGSLEGRGRALRVGGRSPREGAVPGVGGRGREQRQTN